jgi:serine/threonine-protein kinase
MRLAPGNRLGPYEILAPLGAGGLGEVYRARDSRLQREVAIKVLPEHLADDREASARFQREAQAVAALNHPNILAIHDLGDQEGIAYAVMEVLEGETLRSRLNRLALPWQETVEIGIALAGGLSAAHGKGIVHRDIKPENIFLTSEGRVKILDFGLARWVSPPSTCHATTELTVTQHGVVMGTVAYMSPEQVRGLLVGIPSDIFSLGCVLFEMVCGVRAFDRPSSAETVAAILTENPPQMSSSGRQVPVELERVVAHCLKKRPQERYQSGGELAYHLQALGTPPSVLREQADAIDSLAVLPFLNVGANPETEYLSDGLAESLINSLSQMPNLRVVARSRAFRYKGQEVDPKRVGRQLKVQALLTGKVFERGDTIIVQAELVDVGRESQLWGERFNWKTADIFAVEEEIANQIAGKLRLKLSGQQRERLLNHHTKDTEAYHFYLKGRYHWNKRTRDGLKKGLEYFQQAIDKDPAYAMPYAGVADSFVVLSVFDPTPGKAFSAKSKTAALKALEIDPALAEALTTLGLAQGCLDWAWSEGERSLRRAIALRPDYWLAHNHCGMLLSAMGRHEEAVREVRLGLELDPLSIVASHHFAWVHIRARLYAQAIEQLQNALEMDPNFPMGNFWMGLACALMSRYDEAIRALETAHRTVGASFASLELARVYAISGREAEARQMLFETEQNFPEKYAEPYSLAQVHAALGETDLAVQWMERAWQDRTSFFALWVNGDPRLDSLRSDARIDDLLRSMDFGSGLR